MATSTVIADLVKAFGLKHEADLARLLKLRSPGTLSNWKSENRIPWNRYFQIQELATAQQVKLPDRFLAIGRNKAA